MRMRRSIMPTYIKKVKGLEAKRPGENGSSILHCTLWKLGRENSKTVITLLIRIEQVHFLQGL